MRLEKKTPVGRVRADVFLFSFVFFCHLFRLFFSFVVDTEKCRRRHRPITSRRLGSFFVFFFFFSSSSVVSLFPFFSLILFPFFIRLFIEPKKRERVDGNQKGNGSENDSNYAGTAPRLQLKEIRRRSHHRHHLKRTHANEPILIGSTSFFLSFFFTKNGSPPTIESRWICRNDPIATRDRIDE